MLDPSRLPLNATTVGFRKRMHLEVDEKAFAFELQRQTDCIKVRREEKETPISEVHVMGGQLFGIGGNSKTNEYARQQRQINGYALRHFSASGPIVLPPKHADGLLQTPHNVGLTQYVPIGVGVVGGSYASQFTEVNALHMGEGMAHEQKNLQSEMQQSHEDRQKNIMKWDNRRSQAHQNRLASERAGVRADMPGQRQALNAQIAGFHAQQAQNAPPAHMHNAQHAAVNAFAANHAAQVVLRQAQMAAAGAAPQAAAALPAPPQAQKKARSSLSAAAQASAAVGSPSGWMAPALAPVSPAVTTASAGSVVSAGGRSGADLQAELDKNRREMAKLGSKKLKTTNAAKEAEYEARIEALIDANMLLEQEIMAMAPQASAAPYPIAAGVHTAYAAASPPSAAASPSIISRALNYFGSPNKPVQVVPQSIAATPTSITGRTSAFPSAIPRLTGGSSKGSNRAAVAVVPTFSAPLQASGLAPPSASGLGSYQGY